jgi:hypothetical protein
MTLIMAMHRVAQRNLPLTLVGAGLPQIIALTGKSKSYAERLFDLPEVGPLSPPDARNAIQSPVRNQGVQFNEDALDEVIQKTERYPYFLHSAVETGKFAAEFPFDFNDIVSLRLIPGRIG